MPLAGILLLRRESPQLVDFTLAKARREARRFIENLACEAKAKTLAKLQKWARCAAFPPHIALVYMADFIMQDNVHCVANRAFQRMLCIGELALHERVRV